MFTFLLKFSKTRNPININMVKQQSCFFKSLTKSKHCYKSAIQLKTNAHKLLSICLMFTHYMSCNSRRSTSYATICKRHNKHKMITIICPSAALKPTQMLMRAWKLHGFNDIIFKLTEYNNVASWLHEAHRSHASMRKRLLRLSYDS